ncbi:MAG: carboxymuconolactone decarboxylase family protein [Terriglobales bacterium]
MSGKDGIGGDDLRDLPRFAESPRFTAPEKAALRLAEALSHAPADVSDAVYAETLQWWSAEQVIELAGVVAWENFRARFNRAFDVEAAGFAQGAVCAVAEH